MKHALLIVFVLSQAPWAVGQPAPPLDAATRDEILEQIGKLPMSSALYYSVLQSLGVQPPPPPAYGPETTVLEAAIEPDFSTLGPYQVTNDSNNDAEPSITSAVLSGNRYFTTAYFRYHYEDSLWLPRIRTSRTLDGFSTYQTVELALPPRPPGASYDYKVSFDPYIVTNTGGGVAPGRQYVVGICHAEFSNAPTGVYVWRSDNAGLTWSSPVAVAVIPSDSYLFVDKPNIAVNTNNGHVYVTYLRYDGHSGQENQTIAYVSRSTDGGLTFSASPVAAVTGNIGGPQVAANTSNNSTYLVWADYGANVIRVATSTDDGLSFPQQGWRSENARNSLLGPCGNGCPVLRTGIRAYSLPIARYNAAAHVLGVVWHERELGTSGNPAITDTVYAYYDGTQWQPTTPILINNPFANVDNFQPALESGGAAGNVLIVWYDTGSDPNGLRYRTLWELRSYSGQFWYAGGGGFLSRPGDLPGLAKIGDYQDIVSVPNGPYYGRFVHAWVGVPESPHQADIYLWDTRE